MIRAARGGSPALHDQREEGRGYAPKRAPKGAWVLMVRGCKPQTKGRSVGRSRLAEDRAMDGSRMAETATAGSVHDSPVRRVRLASVIEKVVPLVQGPCSGRRQY